MKIKKCVLIAGAYCAPVVFVQGSGRVSENELFEIILAIHTNSIPMILSVLLHNHKYLFTEGQLFVR